MTTNTLTLAFVGPADISEQVIADSLEDFLGLQREGDDLVLTRSLKIYLPTSEALEGPGVDKVRDFFFNAEFMADDNIDLELFAFGPTFVEDFDDCKPVEDDKVANWLAGTLSAANDGHLVFLWGDNPEGDLLFSVLESAQKKKVSSLDLTAALDSLSFDPTPEAEPEPEPEPEAPKRGRGRPRKTEAVAEKLTEEETPLTEEEPPKPAARRGRKPKAAATSAPEVTSEPETVPAEPAVEPVTPVDGQMEFNLGDVSILAVLQDISQSLRIIARQDVRTK